MKRSEMTERLDELEVEYKGNAKNTELAELIAEHDPDMAVMARAAELEKEEAEAKAAKEAEAELDAKKAKPMSKGARNAEARKKALKLVRCIITPMDKDKSEYQGEIFSCANSMTGFIKKFIPFNKEYHIPQLLLDTIKEKRTLSTKERKAPNGMIVKDNIEIPQFSVQVLPDLTQEELDRITKS